VPCLTCTFGTHDIAAKYVCMYVCSKGAVVVMAISTTRGHSRTISTRGPTRPPDKSTRRLKRPNARERPELQVRTLQTSTSHLHTPHDAHPGLGIPRAWLPSSASMLLLYLPTCTLLGASAGTPPRNPPGPLATAHLYRLLGTPWRIPHCLPKVRVQPFPSYRQCSSSSRSLVEALVSPSLSASRSNALPAQHCLQPNPTTSPQ